MIQVLTTRLKEQREGKHLSQKEVANAIGVSASIISNYENGERLPSLENLILLARFYRCSTDYLLGIDKPKGKYMDVSMLSEKHFALLQEFLSSLSG